MLFSLKSLFLQIPTRSRRTFVYNKIPKQTCKFWNSFRHLHSDDVQDTDKIVEDLCKGDKELEKKLRILMLEVDVMRQDGRNAPDCMKANHWEHLLQLGSRNQRNNYLKYLWKTEKSKQNDKERKAERKKEFEERGVEKVKDFPDDLEYGISHQSLFLRIRDQSINAFDNSRAIQAMVFGQNVVIDCSYEDQMVWREAINAAKQTTYVFGDNRIHKEPFNLHLCNVNMKGEFMKQLVKNIPSVLEPWFPLNIHECSYLDVFPKRDLVYLTPHCRDELNSFDHDAVYIVGCMVDKVNNDPLSLAKAKRDGIKMAKLPLDRYLEWGSGSRKTLNINHMIQILLDMKVSSDWEYALRHVPRRKLLQSQLYASQNSKSGSSQNFQNSNISMKIRRQYVNDRSSNKKHPLFDDNDKF